MGSSPTFGEKIFEYSKNNVLQIYLTECIKAIEKKNLINSSIIYSTEKTIQQKIRKKGDH